jgi:biotin transporter BioY
MKSRFQIVISNREYSADRASAPLGFWARFKILFLGLALTVVVLAVLVAALLLGSVLAAVLWIVFVMAVAIAILRKTLTRLQR